MAVLKAAGPSPTLVAVALACLCLQNSALVLSMKYTRSVLKETYLTSTAVVVMECVKFALSWAMMYTDGARTSDVVVALGRSLPMCVPSFLYVMQNSLQFVAINHLDASSFTILSQLKILTTAVCSVLMLGTHLSLRKWRALVLLVIGAILVQFPTASPTATAAAAGKRTSVTGLAAVIGMVCLSGVAGIWLEKYLKNKDAPVSSVPQAAPTLWERNLQLSLYGMLFGLASVVLNDAQTVRELGFFQSYSAWTLLVILIAAVGGLIVAVVVKYTSTIVKGFAASCSIMLTSVVSLALFPSDELGWLFWLGASCVLLSIFNFNEEDAKASSSAPVELSSMDARNGVGFGGLDKPSKQSSSPYGVTRALEQSRLENDNVSSESETSELVKNGR